MKKSLIRKIKSSASKSPKRGGGRSEDSSSEIENVKLVRGDKVEARYKGKSKYYKVSI